MIALLIWASLFRYSAGSCAVFDPTKFSQPVEGIVMTVIALKGDVYVVRLPHPKFKKPTLFRIEARKFDYLTLAVECK